MHLGYLWSFCVKAMLQFRVKGNISEIKEVLLIAEKGGLFNALSIRAGRKSVGCNKTTKGLFGKRKNVSEFISLL